MVWAVVPLKNLARAKRRLAGVLNERQRRALVEAMARDVLAVLNRHPGVEHTVIVSNETALQPLAGEFGAEWMDDPVGAESLSEVVSGVAEALSHRGVDALLVVHGDLPLLNSGELRILLEQHQNMQVPAVTLVPDRSGKGTNCLLASPPTAIEFHYGPDSLNRHLGSAELSGTAAQLCHLPRAAVDMDTPADLDRLAQETVVGQRTASWLVSEGSTLGIDCAPSDGVRELLSRAAQGHLLSEEACLSLAGIAPADPLTEEMMATAAELRDCGFPNAITYSRKVFIPLTHLCRDVCHYCTFAKTPGSLQAPFMSVEQVVSQVRLAQQQGCKEALFTLGEKPELRYKAAREALREMGFGSTLDYVTHVARAVLEQTDVLPHINAGCMSETEIRELRQVSASMGMMLESSSERLCEKGGPHYGSPDKAPALRLQTIEDAGRQQVPFTSGILIGIGETRRERIESLLALRRLHHRYGHLQEVIIQNFRAKPNTKMAAAPEPDLQELLWTVAAARLIFGAGMSIQVPPNLSPGVLPRLVAAGINDWGGVSPVTPDYVNPEAPWPHLKTLADETAAAGKFLQQRLTIYPAYVVEGTRWLDPALFKKVLPAIDAEGFARGEFWCAGQPGEPPVFSKAIPGPASVSTEVRRIVDAATAGKPLVEDDLVRLFRARGPEVDYICRQADAMRRAVCGDAVSFVVNRNINYTNICSFKCQFCAFSKGRLSENLRGLPYDLSLEEIGRRCAEAWDRGATEVCMQGGIHPDYDGNTYIELLQAVKASAPGLHIHAFSPLEIVHGAQTLNMGLDSYLRRLQSEGLGTLPGTAAEILDDGVRQQICPDKINTGAWLEVMETAHRIGLKTTATMMFGHVEGYRHWARHLIRILELQDRTGGFTEFVPLPFVPMESPIFRKGRARRGPTFREVLLVHAVARLVLSPAIPNIQASWVKLGRAGVVACLNAGVNDLGGTLMNESITRAAGATHGQEFSPQVLETIIRELQRQPRQRNTDYSDATAERQRTGRRAPGLTEIHNTAPVRKSGCGARRSDALIVSG